VVKPHEDSISYIAAEKQYMNSSYRQAITGFRTWFENNLLSGRSKYCTAAQFYIADSYYRLEDYEHALSEISQPIWQSYKGNQYMEKLWPAQLKLPDDQKRYGAGLWNILRNWFKLPQSSERKNTARLVCVRSSLSTEGLSDK